jgi:phosphotransferase system  glucose/maltose/N-acetylglucosamine-specific IIC component
MSNKKFLFAVPVLFVIAIYGITIITNLLRQQSDIAVIVGLMVAFAYMVGFYYIIKFLTKKTKKTDEKNNSNS